MLFLNWQTESSNHLRLSPLSRTGNGRERGFAVADAALPGQPDEDPAVPPSPDPVTSSPGEPVGLSGRDAAMAVAFNVKSGMKTNKRKKRVRSVGAMHGVSFALVYIHKACSLRLLTFDVTSPIPRHQICNVKRL